MEPMGMLPIVTGERLAGVITQTDLAPLLKNLDPADREREMQRPVVEFASRPAALLRAEMSIEAVSAVFAETRSAMLPVLDQNDYYLGVVAAADLLAPELPAPRPVRIGGMATPFGVYLTDGTNQAGAGNGALMATGMMMSFMWIMALNLIGLALYGIGLLIHRPLALMPLLNDDTPIDNPWLGLGSVLISQMGLFLFMSIMRMTRLAGYHAAEHQTVHAIERFEPLTPGVVQRMPRAHPRCGTNLMAAVVSFMSLREAMRYVPMLGGGVEIIAAVATLFIWRPFGVFLQERFTTKPANEREITSGIAAGTSLLARFVETAPSRPSVLRRVWCSGMLQVLIGSIPLSVLYFAICYWTNWRMVFHL